MNNKNRVYMAIEEIKEWLDLEKIHFNTGDIAVLKFRSKPNGFPSVPLEILENFYKMFKSNLPDGVYALAIPDMMDICQYSTSQLERYAEMISEILNERMGEIK